jgi:endoribonuclease Dicer
MLEEVSDKDDDDILLSKQKSSGTRCYPRRKPDFWANSVGVFHGRLYPTAISIDGHDDPLSPHQPLLILTRLPLPPIESFKLFFAGIPCNVYFQTGAPFDVSEEQLQLLHKYTQRICRTVANKPFICKLEELVYFIAPLDSQWNRLDSSIHKWDLPDLASHIPWHLVTSAASNWVVALNRDTVESLTEDIRDAVVQDRWVEFTRRYEAVAVRPDLTPMSRPDDSPVSIKHLYHSLIY